MASFLLMIFLAVVATAIAVVPATVILWRESHGPRPITRSPSRWVDSDEWRRWAADPEAAEAR